MPNPRKGKIPHTLWMTPEEMKGLEEIMGNDSLVRYVGRFLNQLKERGDFERR